MPVMLVVVQVQVLGRCKGRARGGGEMVAIVANGTGEEGLNEAKQAASASDVSYYSVASQPHRNA